MPETTLATLCPLEPYTAADGTFYQSYYIPQKGIYLLLKKTTGGAYSYFTCINDVDYSICWRNKEQMAYALQAPSGIDFSAIVLRDALQDTVNSNQEVGSAIADNQAMQLVNQAAIREYQRITSEKVPLTDTQLRASPVPVSIPSSINVAGNFFPATQPVSLATMPTTPVTGQFWPAVQHVVVDNPNSSVTIANPVTSVSVSNQPTTYPVTGNFWQSVQPVSGPVTDSQLRAAPVPVNVTFPGTQVVSGSVAITNYPVSQRVTIDNPTTAVSVTNQPATYPVTGSFWQTTQPVSGTFWQATQPVSGPATDAQLRTTPLPVAVSFPTSQHVTVDNPTSTITVANPVTTVGVSSLPTGLSTSANQLIELTSLASIDSKLTGPLSTKVITSTTGGTSSRLVVSNAASTTPTVVKSSAGQLYGITAANVSNTLAYLTLYNKASAPAVNDAIAAIYPLLAGQTLTIPFSTGATYTTGIAFTLTSNLPLGVGGIVSLLTGILVANQVIVNIEYA